MMENEFERAVAENTPRELLHMLAECCRMEGKCEALATRTLADVQIRHAPESDYFFWANEHKDQLIRAERLTALIEEKMEEAGIADGGEPPIARAEAAEDMVLHLAAAMRAEAEEARVIGYEEIAAMPKGTVLWEEFYNGEEGAWTCLEMVFKSDDAQLSGTDTTTFILPGMDEPDVDGNRFRWWTAKPTEAQRRAAT